MSHSSLIFRAGVRLWSLSTGRFAGLPRVFRPISFMPNRRAWRGVLMTSSGLQRIFGSHGRSESVTAASADRGCLRRSSDAEEQAWTSNSPRSGSSCSPTASTSTMRKGAPGLSVPTPSAQWPSSAAYSTALGPRTTNASTASGGSSPFGGYTAAPWPRTSGCAPTRCRSSHRYRVWRSPARPRR
jgi:hypothetical protein